MIVGDDGGGRETRSRNEVEKRGRETRKKRVVFSHLAKGGLKVFVFG